MLQRRAGRRRATCRLRLRRQRRRGAARGGARVQDGGTQQRRRGADGDDLVEQVRLVELEEELNDLARSRKMHRQIDQPPAVAIARGRALACRRRGSRGQAQRARHAQVAEGLLVTVAHAHGAQPQLVGGARAHEHAQRHLSLHAAAQLAVEPATAAVQPWHGRERRGGGRPQRDGELQPVAPPREDKGEGCGTVGQRGLRHA